MALPDSSKLCTELAVRGAMVLLSSLLAFGCGEPRPPEQGGRESARPGSEEPPPLERSPAHTAERAPGEPPPRSEPELARRFDGKPALASQRGVATYYGSEFAGRSTASGEPYDPRGFTAAHRTLPFGTVVRVERLDVGRQVYVRITDRGPFGSRARILDLSRAAAEQLDMLRRGVAEVRLEVVQFGPKRKRKTRRGR